MNLSHYGQDVWTQLDMVALEQEGVALFDLICCVCTVPVRKKFPTVEYFFYGDTRSTKNSTRTTSLCYGSGIQRTAQYVSTLTTRTSVAMIT